MNIFFLRGVFFSRNKAPFLTKETVVESETHFSREAIKNYCGNILKENPITGRSWISAKLKQ